MTPRRAALAGVLITLVAVLAAVVAVSSRGSATVAAATGQASPGAPAQLLDPSRAPQAPELTGITAFDNTAPLTLAQLHGTVVLVDFWTYTCINCRRTFPFLHALTKAYGPSGFTVLGVHSPEFGFEKKHSNVARAVKELGVTWPVAEDPDMDTWAAFQNNAWPADYLIDRQGRVRYLHIGEGDEDQVESAVRALLDEGGTAPAAGVARTTDPALDLTPETYFGAEHGGQGLAGGLPVAAGSTLRRDDPPQSPGTPRLEGTVTGSQEYVQLDAGASLTDVVHARDAYVTAATSGRPVTLDVTLDGKPVPPARRGPSLRVVRGRTVVTVTTQDLYHLLTGPAVADGTLRLTDPAGGARLFTLTFGG